MSFDKIIIRDLQVQGMLGIYPEERIIKQDILVNIVIYVDINKAAISSDLGLSVNYHEVVKCVSRHIEEGQYYLVETLVLDLARIIVLEFGVERVIVRVEKPAAIPSTRGVGVEIERNAGDFISESSA
jgi:7,8-dihydroneopterin aldolase/epimerase/oxygenase